MERLSWRAELSTGIHGTRLARSLEIPGSARFGVGRWNVLFFVSYRKTGQDSGGDGRDIGGYWKWRPREGQDVLYVSGLVRRLEAWKYMPGRVGSIHTMQNIRNKI